MKTIIKSFFKGLLVVVPLVATVYFVYMVVTFVDEVTQAPVPGLGLVLTFVTITLIGVLASNVVGHKVVSWLEKGIDRLPVVKLLYSSVKDLLGAFVGDRKSFGNPVLLEVSPGLKALGFVTCDHFESPELTGYVAVYLPQSYNFAGNLLVVPRDRVTPLAVDGAQFMAFIVSGGVSAMRADSTSAKEPASRPPSETDTDLISP